jgi:hypothetical protein
MSWQVAFFFFSSPPFKPVGTVPFRQRAVMKYSRASLIEFSYPE